MATEMDVAKMMFGWADHDYSFYNNFSSNNAGGGSASMRYGSVVSLGEGNQIEVRIDGSEQTVYGTCDTPVKVGDRVSVVYRGGSYLFYTIKTYIEKNQDKLDQLNQDIINSGESIKQEIAADIQRVENAANDAVVKADAASKEVVQIKTTVGKLEGEVNGYSVAIQGAVNKADSAYQTATKAQADLTGFKTTVADTYETKTNVSNAIAEEVLNRNSAIEQSAKEITTKVAQDYQSKSDAGTMESNLQSQITQNAQSIITEVSDRKQAITGAIQESKTYVDQQADKITTTVEGKVMDNVGKTYVSKNEFEITSQGFSSKITAAVNSAEQAKTTANSASIAANDAASKAIDAAKTATNFLNYSSSGLAIGNSNLSTSVLIQPSAIKFKNNNTVLAEYGDNYATIGTENKGQLRLSTTGAAFTDRGKPYLTFEPNYGASTISAESGSQLYLMGNNGIVLNGGSGGPPTQMHNCNPLQRLEQNPSVVNNVSNTMGCVILYRNQPNGTTGSITLKRSIDNYAYIDIIFRDAGSNRRYWCQRIYNPSAYYDGRHHYGVHTALHGTVTSGSATYTFSAMCEITSTRIIRGITYQNNVESSNNCGVRSIDIFITHVIGWR